MARSTPAQKPRGLASNSSMFILLETVQNQQKSAAGDRRIGKIERRKIMLIPMKRQKVHHITIRNSIDQVAQRAAEYHAQREGKQHVRLVFAQQPDYP